MKKQIVHAFLAIAMFAGIAKAQGPQMHTCDTYGAMERYFASNPQARQNFEASQAAFNKAIIDGQSHYAAKSTAAVVYTVPVVFHILYLCEADNTPDNQIIDALAQINDDYSRNGADTNTIFTPFKSLYVDCGIKFVLARKDENGNCTSGIIHRYDYRTDWKQADQSYYNGIAWDPTKYLNILIVRDIIASNPSSISGGQVGGYTWLPGTWSVGADQDCIVYRNSMLGGYGARALSHEIGHWLNLSHTFGNTNNPGTVCGDDNVNDTPKTKGNFSNCPAASTNTAHTCAAPQAGTGLYYQNVENIMDYSNCAKNFTQGQADRMVTSLTITPSPGSRKNLWTNANLLFTGVNNTTPCAPIANFLASNCVYTLCAGSSITLRDYSYNGPVTTYQWAGTSGAVMANPTASATSASFPNIGTSVVTFTASNAQGSSVCTRTITVVDGVAGMIGTFNESFENGPVPTGWTVTNNNVGSSEWEQTMSTSLDAAACFYVKGSNCGAKEEDYLQMPVIDVANSPTKVFSFAYAYAQYDASCDDALKIQGSKDCGGTWANIVVLSASQMQAGSGGVTTNPFTPSGAQEWKTYTVSNHPNWAAYKNSSSVMLRFNFVEGTAGHGNNIFIDAVNFSSGLDVGVNELTKTFKFSVYPNPTDNEATVNFSLSEAARVDVSVVDLLGKKMIDVRQGTMEAGSHAISVNKDAVLSAGIYFINLEVNGAKMTHKLVVN